MLADILFCIQMALLILAFNLLSILALILVIQLVPSNEIDKNERKLASISIERVLRALDKFKCFDDDLEFEGVSRKSLCKCRLCGSDAEVYDNTRYAVLCSNLNCDLSLAGTYSPYWRTNITKAVNDWIDKNKKIEVK